MWFQRQRTVRDLIYASGDTEEMLLLPDQAEPTFGPDVAKALEDEDNDTLLLDKIKGNHDEEMLFAGDVVDVPSLVLSSQSTESTIWHHPPSQVQILPRHRDDALKIHEISTPPMTKLAMTALQTILTGTQGRRKTATKESQPKASLAQIVPTMFSPGFSNVSPSLHVFQVHRGSVSRS